MCLSFRICKVALRMLLRRVPCVTSDGDAFSTAPGTHLYRLFCTAFSLELVSCGPAARGDPSQHSRKLRICAYRLVTSLWTKGTGSPGYLPPGAGCDGQTAVRLRQAVWSCSLGGDAGHYGDLVTLLPPHLDLLGDRSLALFFSLYPLN